MSKENENQKAFNVLSDMALLMSDTQQISDVAEQKDDLETLLRAFLCGDFADNIRLRNSILVLTDHFKTFLELLEKYSQEDLEAALQNLKKLSYAV